jgi:hypothetical protein
VQNGSALLSFQDVAMNAVKQRVVLILSPDDHIAVLKPQVLASCHFFNRNSGGLGLRVFYVVFSFEVGGSGCGNGLK